jgi:hypothetical protein
LGRGVSLLILGKIIAKISNLESKFRYLGILHVFNEKFNKEKAFYGPQLYKVKITVINFIILNMSEIISRVTISVSHGINTTWNNLAPPSRHLPVIWRKTKFWSIYDIN